MLGLDVLSAFDNLYADVFPATNESYAELASTSDFAN
jgi:hypothetical protein